MARILKFHCNNCGGENLLFHAQAKWTGVTFELQETEIRSAYCNDCRDLTKTFQSEEIIFGGEKPKSNYDPLTKTGNL